MASDYERAKAGATDIKRWEKGVPHHPMSIRLMKFLEEHDLKDYGDYFGWYTGMDGDNGETLMYEMDAFFELMAEDEVLGALYRQAK